MAGRGRRAGIAAALLAVLLVAPMAAGASLSDAGASQNPLAGKLGVFRHANPSAVAEYEAWLGAPVSWAVTFLPQSDWTAIQNPSWYINVWAGSGRKVVYSVPMLPSGYSLEAGARGEYNAHWKRFAETFVARGAGDAVIRLGWEFNGKFYPWAAGGKEDHFAAYWRQIVNTTRAVPGAKFVWDWSPLAGNTNADVERAYPGDAYVDIIGLDAYDITAVKTSPEARWVAIRDQRYGLSWHRNFAKARGKPVSFPEWGVFTRAHDDLGGDDNPYYIERMHEWFLTSNLVYAAYFEVDAVDGAHRLMTGQFPKSRDAFLRLFSG